ncbi:MAG: hypothetical protein WBG57_01160 [Ornithinimicrobium sp.]
MVVDSKLLQIYVADHRAMSAGVTQRLAQMAEYTHLSFVGEIDLMHHEFIAEQAWLETLARRHGVAGGTVKRSAAQLGEILGRFKLNGRLRSKSPLSPLIEIEMLIAAIAVKITFFQTLAAVPGLTEDSEQVSELLDQAHQQFEHATKWHRALRREAFTSRHV